MQGVETITEIFVNYRREDTAAEAGRITSALRDSLDDEAVFMDTSSLQPGDCWPPLIQGRLRESKIVVVVIGPDWLRAGMNKWGQRRIDHDDDCVRLEIAVALESKKEVLPVLVRGGVLPPAEALPASIKELARRQAIDIRTDYWEHDMAMLLNRIAPNRRQLRKSLEVREETLSHKRFLLTENMVKFSASAGGDCAALGMDKQSALEFIIGEATRHPLLFQRPFAATQLIFGKNVLLLSWDGSDATIERILNRQQAYPLNDVWTSCLATYRQATCLSYRTDGPSELIVPKKAQRALNMHRQLVSRVKELLQVLRRNEQSAPYVEDDLDSLLEEAEVSVSSGDVGTAIARMEALLSTAHKLILEFAPTGPLVAPPGAPLQAKVVISPPGHVSILVVEDSDLERAFLVKRLKRPDVNVVSVCSSSEALKAIVEHEFDIVITDLVLQTSSDQMDGREVALAAIRSSKKTFVIVYTAFLGMSLAADLLRIGISDFVQKHELFDKDFLADRLNIWIEKVKRNGE